MQALASRVFLLQQVCAEGISHLPFTAVAYDVAAAMATAQSPMVIWSGVSYWEAETYRLCLPSFMQRRIAT